MPDVKARRAIEDRRFPYNWFEDKAYNTRGGLQGTLVLSDGRPASRAAVFLVVGRGLDLDPCPAEDHGSTLGPTGVAAQPLSRPVAPALG